MAPSTVRRVLTGLLILSLPTVVAIFVYFMTRQRIVPTNPNLAAQVMTIAGRGAPGTGDGARREAIFSNPFGITVDRRGEVIMSDGGASNSIRRITADGNIQTITGSTEGFQDGPVATALFNTPSGLAADKDANIIIADTSNNRIRKLSGDRTIVTTIAGSGAAGYLDGPATEAQFDGPIGVAVDKDGNIIVADSYNDRIRKIASDGSVTTIAGTGAPGYQDGAAAGAMFDTPCGVAVDREGNILVADTGNRAIRKITAQGEVTTLLKDEQPVVEGQPPVTLRRPVGLALTHDGFLFVTDEATGQVLRLTPELHASVFAGAGSGYMDGPGRLARFNCPAGIAIDRDGNLFVADSSNYLIRMIASVEAKTEVQTIKAPDVFIQPQAEPLNSTPESVVPHLDPASLNTGQTFPWPIAPQDQPHEVTGVVGEARGASGGIALDHLHSGLDIRGNMGEAALSVMDEKVSSPIPAWGLGSSGEGIRVGLMSYIHIRVGRDQKDVITQSDRFKAVTDGAGKLIAVRVRRGTRFKAGDFIGTLNSLYHVHLNLGPWNAQANPIGFPFPGLKDTIAPTIEPDGIEIVNQESAPFKQKRNGRLVITGDVDILVTAYDRADGNANNRKLGLYRAGYQVLGESGIPVKGFEQPLINIEFNRLPPDDEATQLVYGEGSGVSAYGTPTKFKYIVTNRVRDGDARDGLLRTSQLGPGNYIIRIEAIDYAGNRATGKTAELAVTVE